MKWTKLPEYTGKIHQGECSCCQQVTRRACMKMEIAVGFGTGQVTKNGEVIYDEVDFDAGTFWTVQDAEKAARKEPDNDWRIFMESPSRSRTYQRHGQNECILIESGLGFA